MNFKGLRVVNYYFFHLILLSFTLFTHFINTKLQFSISPSLCVKSHILLLKSMTLLLWCKWVVQAQTC